MTNSKGYFQLPDQKGYNVTIFHIGYENFSFNQDTVTTTSIILKSKPYRIDEVKIHPIDAKKIVINSVNSIGENYLNSNSHQGAYYKESLFENAKLKKISNCELVINKMPYNVPLKDEIFVKTFRSYVIDSTPTDIINGAISIFKQCDLVKNRSYILDNKNIESHNFVVTSISPYQNTTAYFIKFNPKRRSFLGSSNYSGEIVIDTASFAILYASFIRDGKIKDLGNDKITVKYSKYNGKYTLSDAYKSVIKDDKKAEVVLVINDFNYKENWNTLQKIENNIPLKNYLVENRNKDNVLLEDTISTFNPISKISKYRPSFSFLYGNSFNKRTDLLSCNFNSFDYLVDYTLSHKIKNGSIGSLSQTFYHYCISTPFASVLAESALLNKNNIEHSISPFNMNKYMTSYCKDIDEARLQLLNSSNRFDFLRLYSIKYELIYEMNNRTENQLFMNNYSLNSFSDVFLMNVLFKRSTLFLSYLLAGQEIIKNENRSYFSDRVLNNVYHLTTDNPGFVSSVSKNDLNSEGIKLLNRVRWFSFLNLISPFIIGKQEIEINPNVKMNFSLGYLLTPVGESFLQNYWFKINNNPYKVEFSLLHSKYRFDYGIGVSFLDQKISNRISLSTKISYWNQPMDGDYKNQIMNNGFSVEQNLNYKITDRFNLLAGYTLKTPGLVVNNLEYKQSNQLWIGLMLKL